jgi:hypothetical protein
VSASAGCQGEHVSCGPELEIFLSVQGADNEGGGQFKMDTRSSLNLAYLEGSIIKEFQKKSSGLEESGLRRKPSGTEDLANLHRLAAGDGDAAVDGGLS